MAMMPPRVPGLKGDLALDHAVIFVVDGNFTLAVVVVVAMLIILAPLALVGDLTRAFLAGRADAVGQLYKAEDVFLLLGRRRLVLHKGPSGWVRGKGER